MDQLRPLGRVGLEQGELRLGQLFGLPEEGREFLVGNSFSVADLNVAAVFSWAVPAKLDLSEFPNLSRWLKACVSRPAARAALAK